MVKSPRLFLIGTSLLLLAAIRCTQAAAIKIVSPSAYENTEGAGVVGGNFSPFRYQQVFPAADFAALGNKPHWLVSFTIRPDRSVTSPRTVHFPDNELRFAFLSRGALEGICRLDVKRIIYVSCDVATLARDARALVNTGYAVNRLDAFDLFPNTPHVETVVVFQKN